jgi:O-antigen ligase
MTAPAPASPGWPFAGWALALLAIAAPTLIAAHDPPSVTFYNQALAVLGWGLWMSWLAALPGREARGPGRVGLAALAGVLLIQAAQAAWAGLFSPLPIGLGLMGGGMALAALLAACSGWRVGTGPQRDVGGTMFFGALAAAGGVGLALSLIQVFQPAWADGRIIAIPTMAGRAVGNLRQPNHFSTLMVFACVAVAWLGARGRLPARSAAVYMALFIGAVVLTASRTGMVGMGLLTAWGLLDRRLPAVIRWTLIGAPLIYGAAWGGMWLWSHADPSVAFAAEARLNDGSDISSSRFSIWSNALELIAQQPWTGVGYGRFNFAWSMTPLPDRPVAFFDHTHNLPLQWAVEFGVPLALLMLALALIAFVCLVRPTRQAPVAPDQVGLAGAAGVMVAMAGLHSLLEYPLWYSYFLLPTAFAFGIGLSARARPSEPSSAATPSHRGSEGLGWLGAIMAMMALWCAIDYQSAANIYAPRPCVQMANQLALKPDAQPGLLQRICPGPLDKRIAFGRTMPWWGHQADYAFVNAPDDDEPSLPPRAFSRTVHNLMDARLMMAYARSLAEHGEVDKARYVAERLREFRSSRAKAWLADCEPEQAGGPVPFQCEAPRGRYSWRDVVPANLPQLSTH